METDRAAANWGCCPPLPCSALRLLSCHRCFPPYSATGFKKKKRNERKKKPLLTCWSFLPGWSVVVSLGQGTVAAVPRLSHVKLCEPHSSEPTAVPVSPCPWGQCPPSQNKVPGTVQGSHHRTTGRCPTFRGEEGSVWSEMSGVHPDDLFLRVLACHDQNHHCEVALGASSATRTGCGQCGVGVAPPTAVLKPHVSAKKACGPPSGAQHCSSQPPPPAASSAGQSSSQNPSRPPGHFLCLHFSEPVVSAVSEG